MHTKCIQIERRDMEKFEGWEQSDTLQVKCKLLVNQSDS